MAVSANEVAVALRERLPDLGTLKLHRLLHYCQSHHLATFGKPLFSEAILAREVGPVVGTLWRKEKHGVPPHKGELTSSSLGEAELNTIGYVISRYGSLTAKDLEGHPHSEMPWRTTDPCLSLSDSMISDRLKGLREEPVSADEPDEAEKLLVMRAEILARRPDA